MGQLAGGFPAFGSSSGEPSSFSPIRLLYDVSRDGSKVVIPWLAWYDDHT
jgi:hypothetical protein